MYKFIEIVSQYDETCIHRKLISIDHGLFYILFSHSHFHIQEIRGMTKYTIWINTKCIDLYSPAKSCLYKQLRSDSCIL